MKEKNRRHISCNEICNVMASFTQLKEAFRESWLKKADNVIQLGV